MSELEQKLSRREFIRRGALLGGAVAFQLNLPSLAAQQNPRQIFERSSLYNLDSLPQIILEESKAYTILTSHERNIFDNLVSIKVSKHPALRGKECQFKAAYRTSIVKLEPDEKYANNLIKEARNSIDDIFEFIGSPYLSKPQINFVVPRRKEDIKFTGNPLIPFYLVSNLSRIVRVEYEFDINGEKLLMPEERSESLAAEAVIPITMEVKERGTNRQAKLKISTNAPIFYDTSSDIISMVETPAIEALHRAMIGHTFQNFYEDSKRRDIIFPAEILSLYKEYTHLEEKFVHALSIIWLRQYNEKRKIITKYKLEQRFERYEATEKYKGANKLSQHIERIGVQKAIELYVNNPNQLFKILK